MTIIREGDTVRIVNPRWIKRVGYPLHWREIDAEEKARAMLKAADMPFRDIPRYFLQAVAKLEVERQGFGGNERSIHYCKFAEEGESLWAVISDDEVPHHGYVGREVVVTGKRVAYTGVRFPAYGCDEDYEPGGLDKRKAHVILKTIYGEIEACDVELIKEES